MNASSFCTAEGITVRHDILLPDVALPDMTFPDMTLLDMTLPYTIPPDMTQNHRTDIPSPH